MLDRMGCLVSQKLNRNCTTGKWGEYDVGKKRTLQHTYYYIIGLTTGNTLIILKHMLNILRADFTTFVLTYPSM